LEGIATAIIEGKKPRDPVSTKAVRIIADEVNDNVIVGAIV
jgi:hypothetical protein